MIAPLKKRAFSILLIMAAAFAVYAPSLRNGYVWDDSALIQRDPFIRSWRLIAEGFRHFLFTDATAADFYRPIQRLTYTWDYAWAGFHPAIYHFDNILIHSLAAVFLFLFMERLLTLYGRPRAFAWATVVGVLWAIHPLFTSAVCYISGRADPLAAMFGFCGLWLALRFTRTAAAIAALMFLLSICSKESGGIFMLLCLALLILLHRPRAAVLRWLVMCLLVAAVYCTLRFSAQHQAPPPPTPMSLATRPIVALRAVAEYTGLFLLPLHLHMERDVLPFGHADLATTVRIARNREFQTLLGALLAAGFIVWIRWTRKREPAAFAGLVCFLIAYLPICGLFSLNATVAEHWLYVPAAFLLMAALLSTTHLRIPPAAGIGIVTAWGIFLGVRTFLRNPDWHDQRTFLTETIADAGPNSRMLGNLGGLELTEGHAEKAIEDLKQALVLSPGQPFAAMSLGAAYLHTKQYDLARKEFEKGLDSPLTAADAADDIAIVDYQQYGLDRTDLLERAAALAPENWGIQKRYIMDLAGRGQNFQAITLLRKILARDPWRADGWILIGDFWTNLRRFDFAIDAYEKAAAYDVHDDATRKKLAAIQPAPGLSNLK
ncbi:MAG TPA: hypothetical protein VHY22_18250 [Chthoniobacteraceae bacterium]|jgi:tetratricopeptide (TPR) repeat protein|nr:hypothetical protein [Chthoniobacteraceae bacterium]